MTAPEVLAQRERDRKAYEAAVKRGGMWAEIAAVVSEVITAPSRIGEVLNLVDRLEDLFEEIGVDEHYPSRLDVVGARMAMETVEYPNGWVELDSAGELVSVEFDVAVNCREN
jgi:hypothetical protein